MTLEVLKCSERSIQQLQRDEDEVLSCWSSASHYATHALSMTLSCLTRFCTNDDTTMPISISMTGTSVPVIIVVGGSLVAVYLHRIVCK